MTDRRAATGLLQFLNLEQQRDWLDGKTSLRAASVARATMPNSTAYET